MSYWKAFTSTVGPPTKPKEPLAETRIPTSLMPLPPIVTYSPSFTETEIPVSGIFAPALTPAKMVPVPFTKLNEPSPKPPTQTTALFEATSTLIDSQFVENFRKSPSFTENFAPLRNSAQPGSGLLILPLVSFGSSLGVKGWHEEFPRNAAQKFRSVIISP